MERICHAFGANHLQKELDSKPEMLAPVGERWLGPGWAARPRALATDPEEGVPCTGQDRERKTGDRFGPVCQDPESKDREPLSDRPWPLPKAPSPMQES